MRKGIWSAAAVFVLLVSGAGVFWGGARALADSKVTMDDSDSDALKWHFAPADVSVPVGSTVVWHNGGKQVHTVTADDGKTFSSPNVPEGGEFQFKFATAGDFAYHCDPHPWMKAVIHVTGASAPTTAATTATTQPGTATTATTAAPGQPTTTTAAGASTSSTTATTAAGATTTTAAAAAVTPTSAPDSASSTTTTTAPASQSAEGADGPGKHSKDEKSSPIGIAFAAVSTLLLAAVSAKLLASKP